MIEENDNNMMIVEFEKYCKDCKDGPLDEVKDPCNECLEYGMREGTRVPLYFEKKKQ